MDLNLIKSKLASMQQKSGGSKRDLSVIIWKPAIGKHSVRMVPSAHNKQWPFKELFFHYGIGNRTMISLINFDEKDPIVEFAAQISKSNDKENWQLAKKLQPKMRVFAPVVVRGEEDKGIRLWEFGKEVYMELLAILEDEDVGDFTDPVEGRDLTIDTVGPDQSGRTYNKTSVRVRTKITPLSTNASDVKSWLETQPNPLELFKKYPYEEMKESLLQWLNPESEEEIKPAPINTSTLSPQNTSKIVPELVSAGAGNKYSISTKKNIDDEFDKLFSDTSEPAVADDDDLPF
jgi:hypothetical protein